MATVLFAGWQLSASADVISQQNMTPSQFAPPPLGTPGNAGSLSGVGMGGNGGMPILVPMPAQVFPVEPPQPQLPLVDAPVATVPEPGTLATLGAGLALIAALARRRRAAARG